MGRRVPPGTRVGVSAVDWRSFSGKELHTPSALFLKVTFLGWWDGVLLLRTPYRLLLLLYSVRRVIYKSLLRTSKNFYRTGYEPMSSEGHRC